MKIETNWAPESCTLPTAEQPLRIAEFNDLFAASLQRVDRSGPAAADLVGIGTRGGRPADRDPDG